MPGNIFNVASTTEPVASVKGVTHHYGGALLLLDDITIDIPPGRMVGLIGPDGVGKSSLMGLIGGAEKIQKGKVIVLGGDIADVRHRGAVCPRIAYMPQGLGKNLYFELSVFENIDFFARLFGMAGAERKRRIGDLLEATGLRALSRSARGKALRWHEAEGRALWSLDPRPRSADPRWPDHGCSTLSLTSSSGH